MDKFLGEGAPSGMQIVPKEKHTRLITPPGSAEKMQT